MTTGSASVREAYPAAFEQYLDGGGEAALRSAYELGREAVRQQLGVLELAAIHHAALASALRDRSGEGDLDRVAQAGAEFYMESLSAFEMVQRGYWEATETARLQKEHAARLRKLAAASLAINSTLSRRGILEVLADRSRELIGARCSVVRIVGDRPGATGTEAISCSDGWPGPDGSSPERAGDVLRAPLLGRDRPLGTVQLVDKAEGEFSETDESLLAQLAHIASVAIENADLYERERQIAETLQRRLLPGLLPEIPGVALAARYLPGGVGVEVGGDWYDVIPLPEGRVGIAVGDVLGRGASAAALMGQVRVAFRAYALTGDPPEVVVQRLDRLIQTMELSHFSTMVYLILDPRTGRTSLVRAGHPPPLLLVPQGETAYLEGKAGLPLGVAADSTYESLTQSLVPGSTLLLFTDGLVESRDGLAQGLHRLERSLRRVRGTSVDISTLCDELLEAMVGASPEDDVAILALRLTIDH